LETTFGAVRMARLIPADVERYKAARLSAGATNGTVNRELEVLARAFRLGAKLGLLNATLAVRDQRLAEAAPRAGFFEREQYEAVRRELIAGARPRDGRPDLAVAVTLYHEYGWRLREVLSLERRHVNLDEGEHGTLRLDPGTTKNDEARVVFLTPDTRRLIDEQLVRVEALARQLKRVVPYLFPHLKGRRRGQRVGDFARAWRSACLRAGLAVKVERAGRPALIRAHRTRHDFRRTAVRNLVNASVPEAVAMKITGHKTRAVFDRYHIVSPAELQEASRRLGVASEQAAERAAKARESVTPLAPRLVPTPCTTTGFRARRRTVAVDAISVEVQEPAAIAGARVAAS